MTKLKQGGVYRHGGGYILVYIDSKGEYANVILESGYEGLLKGLDLTDGPHALGPKDFVVDLCKIMSKVHERDDRKT